jgi:hypothetical protein
MPFYPAATWPIGLSFFNWIQRTSWKKKIPIRTADMFTFMSCGSEMIIYSYFSFKGQSLVKITERNAVFATGKYPSHFWRCFYCRQIFFTLVFIAGRFFSCQLANGLFSIEWLLTSKKEEYTDLRYVFTFIMSWSEMSYLFKPLLYGQSLVRFTNQKSEWELFCYKQIFISHHIFDVFIVGGRYSFAL